MRRITLVGILVLVAVTAAVRASDAPKQAGPYDPSLNGWKQLQEAAQRASADGRRVLVIVGGNWCKWCRALDRQMGENAELRDELSAHFELVHLNWSKENKNSRAMKKLGHPEELGFPAFVVVSGTLEVLRVQESSAFENPDKASPGYDPSRLLAFLKKWER